MREMRQSKKLKGVLFSSFKGGPRSLNLTLKERQGQVGWKTLGI